MFYSSVIFEERSIVIQLKKMPETASATGLIAARIRPVFRPKPKNVELTGYTKPAPFALRPFAGLFNPYPYGCSVLCNHPADCEAREVVRRAKDSWATEGKALLLPEEMEMIRASLLAAGGVVVSDGNVGNISVQEIGNADATTVPEELFRKYTETDSRPLTPAPTLASGPALTYPPTQDDLLVTSNPRERTTLILDLRGNSQNQLENDTFTWHALTLEPPPTPRKNEISRKPVARYQPHTPTLPEIPSAPPSPIAEICETGSSKNAENDTNSEEPVIIRRRGKRLRKRKCRRGSTYGQQTEVRDPLEPTETQVSQIEDTSRRPSIHTCLGDSGPLSSPEKISASVTAHAMFSSFIEADILKHLCRELDREKVEAEFSTKKRIALEEALRVKGETHSNIRASRQNFANHQAQNAPRVFSRQAARFEILNSESLRGLTSLEYLSKYVSIISGRKLIFGRTFNRFHEETLQGTRHILSNDVQEALQEVTGKQLTEEQLVYLKGLIGEITKPLDFRTWCGLCAVVERLLCPLPQKEVDPPSWIERADFEVLERRLRSTDVDPQLAMLLKEIRES